MNTKNLTLFVTLAALFAAPATASAGNLSDLQDPCADFTGIAVGSCDNIPGATLVIDTPNIDADLDDPNNDLIPGNVCQELQIGVVFDFGGVPVAVAKYKLMPSNNESKPGKFIETTTGPVSERFAVSEAYFVDEHTLHLEQWECYEFKNLGVSECGDPVVGDFVLDEDTGTVTLTGNMPSGNCSATYL